MNKREKMKAQARKDLARKNKSRRSREKQLQEEDDPPSFFSGVFLIFAGSMVFAVAFTGNQAIFGLLASAPFVFIGMQRIARHTAAKKSEETLSSK